MLSEVFILFFLNARSEGEGSWAIFGSPALLYWLPFLLGRSLAFAKTVMLSLEIVETVTAEFLGIPVEVRQLM